MGTAATQGAELSSEPGSMTGSAKTPSMPVARSSSMSQVYHLLDRDATPGAKNCRVFAGSKENTADGTGYGQSFASSQAPVRTMAAATSPENCEPVSRTRLEAVLGTTFTVYPKKALALVPEAGQHPRDGGSERILGLILTALG